MKKFIVITVGLVLIIFILLFLTIKTSINNQELKNQNEEYLERIEGQTTKTTIFSIESGSYLVGKNVKAGTATIVVVDGKGSFTLTEGKEEKYNSLIGDYEAYKKNNSYICLYRVVLKDGEILKIDGDNIKVSLVYNMLGA